MTEPPPPERPPAGGPLLDEAVKLLAAVQDWARTNLPRATGDAHSDCEWCPLCQLAAVLRGERPEVNEKLSEAGNAVVGVLRALLDPGAREPRTSGHPRVQHIDLGDPGPE